MFLPLIIRTYFRHFFLPPFNFLVLQPVASCVQNMALSRVAQSEQQSGGSLEVFVVRSENGDQTKAVDRLKKTIAWRAEVGASTALSSAQPNFWIIKSFVPHVLHGRDRSGRPVIYSKPSGMQLKILKSHGLSLDDFVKHCKSTSATSCWLLFAFVDF